MKKGWQTKGLGELCEIELGRTPARANGAYWDENRETNNVWLSIADLLNAEDNVVSESREYVSDKGAAICKLVPKGTLLVSFKLTLGRLAFAGRDVFTNEAIAALTIFNERELSKEFLFYCLTFFDWVKAAENDVKLKGMTLNKAKLKVLPVSFPTLPEQQRIVKLLDEAFEGLATAKANAEKNLQNARALFESHLQSVFTQRGPGWAEKRLSDVCDFLNGFAFKSGDVVAESQTQLVRMGNLYGNHLDLNRNPVFYPDSFATEHSRYVLEEGDIIISLTGTTGKEDYGFAVSVPDCGHTLLMNQRIMKFDEIKRDKIDDGYLLHYLRSRCFLDILYPTANGTRQANLSSVAMKLLPVPLPPLKEQKNIAAILDDLRQETQRLARIYEQKLAALDALKKSLLHQAFNGEL